MLSDTSQSECKALLCLGIIHLLRLQNFPKSNISLQNFRKTNISYALIRTRT